MNAKVEDPMGLETGIRIDMVRTVLDKTKGNIIIHGRMTACTRSVVSLDVEPDVECAIIDRDGLRCDRVAQPPQRMFLDQPAGDVYDPRGGCARRYLLGRHQRAAAAAHLSSELRRDRYCYEQQICAHPCRHRGAALYR